MNSHTHREAVLALADGTIFRGTAIGADGSSVGEVVFNTALTGYQEILTDPSYARQIVTLTYPHIGNVGVNKEDEVWPPWRQPSGRRYRQQYRHDHQSKPWVCRGRNEPAQLPASHPSLIVRWLSAGHTPHRQGRL